jgi:DNA helicase-2/ATP-dependent DNA helicase PcrA
MGLVDEVMPGKNTEDNPSRIEEELRLFYVAVTRAQENLTMSYSTTRKTYGDTVEKSKASKFLENVLDVVDYHKAPKNHKNLNYQQR